MKKKKNRGGLYCKYKHKKTNQKSLGILIHLMGQFVSKKIFFFNDTSRGITYKCQIKSGNIIKKKFKSFKKNFKPDGMLYDKKGGYGFVFLVINDKMLFPKRKTFKHNKTQGKKCHQLYVR